MEFEEPDLRRANQLAVGAGFHPCHDGSGSHRNSVDPRINLESDDERMYEELRLRAQTFEVLTGGDFATDHADGLDDIQNAQGKELGVSVLPLPPRMIHDLRVKLQVWEPPDTKANEAIVKAAG